MSQKPSVRAQRLALADVVSDRLLRLHRLWVARRGGRRWPAHTEFSVEALAFVDDTLTLVDVLHDPLHFRMRRIGPSVEELRGLGDQGKLVDEITPPVYGALLRATYTEALNAAEPVFHLIQFLPGVRPPRFPLAYERVILPLSNGGVAIDMLMVATDWSEAITADLRKYHAEG
jgi:hypothetical protein